jgi:hypothetical protein
MSILDPFTRPEVSEILTEVLAGTPSRQELGYGWSDTYNINLVQIRVTAYTKKYRNRPPGTIEIEILAVHPGGKPLSIWLQSGSGLDSLRGLLLNLQKVLLGMAAAFLSLCRDPEDLPIASMGPRSTLDVDEVEDMIRSLLKLDRFPR